MLFNILISFNLILVINCHGFLKDPPARNCMWRYGFDQSPKNYNDNGLNCGGFGLQHFLNNGRCGICGDPWGYKNQPHMDGGRYANNIITRNYTMGQVIDAEVLLTVGHKGFFQFRVGDFTNETVEGDFTGKLKGFLLNVLNGNNDDKTKFTVTKPGLFTYKIKLQLPENLTCKRCVMQWRYTAGNNWGLKQETYANCADISII